MVQTIVVGKKVFGTQIATVKNKSRTEKGEAKWERRVNYEKRLIVDL
jgi:hypothetical protein